MNTDEHNRSLADRRAWTEVTTVADMGDLTARWLERSSTFMPCWLGANPDDDTTPLVTSLARMNRAGLATHWSQPGLEDQRGRRERAFVAGWCERETVTKLTDALACTDLIVLATPVLHGGHSLMRIPVSAQDDTPCTWAGFWDVGEVRYQYAECEGLPDVADLLTRASQVDIIDPVWGRNDLLWGKVERALGY